MTKYGIDDVCYSRPKGPGYVFYSASPFPFAFPCLLAILTLAEFAGANGKSFDGNVFDILSLRVFTKHDFSGQNPRSCTPPWPRISREIKAAAARTRSTMP